MVPDLAAEHVRLMELRIERQAASIEQLKHSGQDISDAVRRLELLKHALEEMHHQLGQLSPTTLDRKRETSSGSTQSAHKK